MTKEKLIDKIMKEAELDGEPLTREEATEVAEMEIKAKGIKVYEQAEKKERKKREVKPDEEKVKLIKLITETLFSVGLDTSIVNPQREIAFSVNGADYSLTLIKHRPPKK